jgi:hypothetical protein
MAKGSTQYFEPIGNFEARLQFASCSLQVLASVDFVSSLGTYLIEREDRMKLSEDSSDNHASREIVDTLTVRRVRKGIAKSAL